MSVSLMSLGYFFRRPALAIGGAVAWLVTGVVNYQWMTTGGWGDIHFGLFWVCIALFLTSLLEGFVLRPRAEQMEPEEEDEDFYERMNRFRGRLPRRGSSRRPRARSSEDEFASSGKL